MARWLVDVYLWESDNDLNQVWTWFTKDRERIQLRGVASCTRCRPRDVTTAIHWNFLDNPFCATLMLKEKFTQTELSEWINSNNLGHTCCVSHFASIFIMHFFTLDLFIPLLFNTCSMLNGCAPIKVEHECVMYYVLVVMALFFFSVFMTLCWTSHLEIRDGCV